MENGKQPITPCTIRGRQGFGDLPSIPNREVFGLTKREYFAAIAMQGFCIVEGFTSMEAVAKASVMQADALLKELEK